MNFIDEENSRNNFGFSFFPPLRYFFVDLLSHLLSNLASSSRKESKETLRSWIDDIDFMESDSVDYLFAFFDLSFRTVDKSGLWTHGIIVRSSCETSSSFWDLSWCFIDCDDISCYYFLFLDCFNHFLSKVVHCFHLCGFQSNFSCFGSRCYITISILDDFSISISTTYPSTI